MKSCNISLLSFLIFFSTRFRLFVTEDLVRLFMKSYNISMSSLSVIYLSILFRLFVIKDWVRLYYRTVCFPFPPSQLISRRPGVVAKLFDKCNISLHYNHPFFSTLFPLLFRTEGDAALQTFFNPFSLLIQSFTSPAGSLRK